MGKRVIAVIGGQLLYDKASDTYRTSTLDDYDNPYSLFGDSLRNDAAAALYWSVGLQDGDIILVIGGVTPLHRTIPGAPLLSRVTCEEIRRLGVPREALYAIDMPDKGGTYNQLLELKAWRSKNAMLYCEIIVVANWWQMPRIFAMTLFSQGRELAELFSGLPALRFAAAEDVLIEHDAQRWWAPISSAYQRPEMQECLRKEYNGARLLSVGEYSFPTVFPQR